MGRIWAVALLVGCLPPDGSLLGILDQEERAWDGEFLIDRVVIDCDARSWRYDVWTQGWGEEIVVQVVIRELERVIWSEQHPMVEVEYGDDWAHHVVELDQRALEEDYVDGQTTLVPCEAKTFVTYGFSAWNYGGELEECVGWGVAPEILFPDCANWGEVDH